MVKVKIDHEELALLCTKRALSPSFSHPCTQTRGQPLEGRASQIPPIRQHHAPDFPASPPNAILGFIFHAVTEKFEDLFHGDEDLHLRLRTLEKECLTNGCDRKEDNNNNNNATASAPSSTKIKPFRCEECKACFHEAKELTAHRQQAHPEQHNAVIVEVPPTPPVTSAPPPSAAAAIVPVPRPANAPTIGRAPHVTASMIRPYACPLCELRFNSCGARNAHRRKVHQRNHLCVECDVAFGSAQKLARHLKTHVGVKEFRCETCNKEFSIERNLALHQKLHLGQKDYACRVCSRTYYTKSGLQAHQRQMHTEEASGFRCSDCPERASTRDASGIAPFPVALCVVYVSVVYIQL